MSAVRHEFLQSPTSVRAGELVTYGFDTTPWGAGASAAVVSAINLRTGADLTSTIFPAGTPSINGAGFYTLPQSAIYVDREYQSLAVVRAPALVRLDESEQGQYAVKPAKAA